MTENDLTHDPQDARTAYHGAPGAPPKLGWLARRTVRREQERAEEVTRAERARAERTATVETATRAAARARAGRPQDKYTGRTPEEIAPVPEKMIQIGVWVDRTVGAIPLLAPLALSGWFTAHVFLDPPMNLPWPVAVLATGALEGGAWKLARIYERTLLEGDSTISLRIGMFGYLSLISGLIYGHAWYQAGQSFDMGWQFAPAAGCALLSWLGVYIWGRSARFQHRVKLRQAGKVDMAAPKFAILSWVVTPFLTAGALRHSIVFRIPSPVAAIEDYRHFRSAGRPKVWPPEPLAVVGELVEDDPLPVGSRAAVRAVPGNGSSRQQLDSVPSRVPRPATVRDTGRAEGDNGAAAVVDVDPHGSRVAGHDAEVVVDRDMLIHADKLLIVVEAFPQWKETTPTVRQIVAAIDAARRVADGGSFNSQSTAGKVRALLLRLAATDTPRAIQQLRAGRDEA